MLFIQHINVHGVHPDEIRLHHSLCCSMHSQDITKIWKTSYLCHTVCNEELNWPLKMQPVCCHFVKHWSRSATKYPFNAELSNNGVYLENYGWWNNTVEYQSSTNKLSNLPSSSRILLWWLNHALCYSYWQILARLQYLFNISENDESNTLANLKQV